MVLGWRRPIILLPARTTDQLTGDQLRAVLAHELAHVRRHDYVTNLFQIAADALLFHHPAARWLSRRIRVEREYCCDDEAMAVARDPNMYARALAALEESRTESRLAVAAASGTLLDRIQRIAGVPRPTLTPLRGSIALVGSAISPPSSSGSPRPCRRRFRSTSSSGCAHRRLAASCRRARRESRCRANVRRQLGMRWTPVFRIGVAYSVALPLAACRKAARSPPSLKLRRAKGSASRRSQRSGSGTRYTDPENAPARFPDHSCRSASSALTRVARRTGSIAATSPADESTSGDDGQHAGIGRRDFVQKARERLRQPDGGHEADDQTGADDNGAVRQKEPRRPARAWRRAPGARRSRGSAGPSSTP